MVDSWAKSSQTYEECSDDVVDTIGTTDKLGNILCILRDLLVKLTDSQTKRLLIVVRDTTKQFADEENEKTALIQAFLSSHGMTTTDSNMYEFVRNLDYEIVTKKERY